ncbi:hypothetical protein [Streptomyces sp. NBC_00046]|uniref:hypothetical protein n=1 Tax=Streptomyces sp. NBC_00046 TaxID=2975626 RepID=UPI00324AFE4E
MPLMEPAAADASPVEERPAVLWPETAVPLPWRVAGTITEAVTPAGSRPPCVADDVVAAQ